MNKHCVHQSHTKQYFCKSRPSTSRLNIKHVEALTTQSGSSLHTPIIVVVVEIGRSTANAIFQQRIRLNVWLDNM